MTISLLCDFYMNIYGRRVVVQCFFLKRNNIYIVLSLNKVGNYCCVLHLVTVSALASMHGKTAGSLKFGVFVRYTSNMHSQPAKL